PYTPSQQLFHRADVALLDAEVRPSFAAHDQIGCVDAPGPDVAALVRDTHGPFAAAFPAELELTREVETAGLLRAKHVLHHAHHRIDVRRAHAMQLHQAHDAALAWLGMIGRRPVTAGWDAVPLARARRVDDEVFLYLAARVGERLQRLLQVAGTLRLVG